MSQTKCWSFVPVSGDIRLRLAEFAALIPDAFKVDNHGELSGPIQLNFHSTFLLGLRDRPGLLDSLRSCVTGLAPIKLRIADVFFSRVQRIDRPTYCVGVAFQEDGMANALRDLKVRCKDACGGVVKYGGTHHCSLAYVPDREDAVGHVRRTVQELGPQLIGLELIVSSVCVQRGPDITEISFGAAAAAAPACSQQQQAGKGGAAVCLGAGHSSGDGAAGSTAVRAQGGRAGNKRPPGSSAGGAAAQESARSEPSGHEKLRQLHNSCKRALINAHVRRGAGMRVLDVGCGRGGDLGKWKDAGASHVHCVDPDEQSLVGPNGVMERSAFLNFPVTTQLGTVLDVVSGEYDIVCYNFSLHYIAPRLAESCAVIAQRLRPGALFIGICPDYDSIMAMGCPFTDRLGNSFRMQDDVLFVAVADPSAPFYAGGERPEPVLHRQRLQSELERRGVRLQSWAPMLQRRNGLISDMYSAFVFRKDR